jgi:hypothetical protein
MLRISLDLDDTLFDWINTHCKKFNMISLNGISSETITKQVNSCRNDKIFWENLPLIERPNFIPECYCTKRINKKIYTKNCLLKHNLPLKPIYQIYTQTRSKADLIKGRCDVLVDDSYNNVMQCIDDGLPALLISRPHNIHIQTTLRINNLNYSEIEQAYERNGFKST